MMQKIKILSALSLTWLLLFSSCEKELYDDAIQTERNIRISKVSIKDPAVFNNRNLMSEIQKVKEKQTLEQASSRIVYDSINNFYFDDENGLKIEDGDLESYTFKIYRESNIESYDIENIVFTSNENGNYNVDLVKYELTEIENTKISNGEFVDLSLNTQVTSLSRFNIDPCFKIVSFPVSYNEEGGVTYSMNILVEIPCPDLGGGGTGGSGGTGGGGFGDYNGPTGPIGSPWEGSSGEGGYGSDPILTSPNGGHATGNTANTPCNLIKKLKKDVEFKNKLASFKNSAATDNFEKYSVIYNDPTPNTTAGQEDAYDYEDFQGAANAQGGAYTGNSTMQGVIHTHYVGLTSIFSPDDLQDMYNQMIYPDITDDFFIGVVTAQGTAYILQVVDRQAFINFGNQYLSTDKKMREFTNNTYKKVYNLTSSNRANNEKNFLKMMDDLGTGLSLAGTTYMPSATTSPNLFSNLQVKTIDDLTQNVKNTNCN